MAQQILKANGRVVLWCTCRPLKVDVIHFATETKNRKIFDGLIERRWGTSINPPSISDTEKEFPEYEEYKGNNMLTQVDADGFLLTMLDAIIYYQKE